MKVEPLGEKSDGPRANELSGDGPIRLSHRSHPTGRRAGWLRDANHHPRVIAFLRRARMTLPGDPHFGDRLSATGFGGPEAAARAAHRLLGDRDAASREVSLATLQIWQALSERAFRRPVQEEVTLVFTDLVGFSQWALGAGDDDTLKLLRQVAQVVEPPLLALGGQVVKRMGDGIMAVFPDPATAIAAVRTARAALKNVDVHGYTPTMRVGIHTGRPQRIGSDWLGVDVNIAARVMESATKGEVFISGAAVERLTLEDLEGLGVHPKRTRRAMFSHRPSGVPADVTMFRLVNRRPASTTGEPKDIPPQS